MPKLRRVHIRIAIAVLALPALALLAGLILQAVFEHEAAAIRAPGNRISIDGDRRLHIICEGSGSPAVILEAGGTHFSTQYMRVLPALATRTRVCAYDRAGMGWSDPSDTPRTARALVDDLDALLVNASISPPYLLVAGSAGGLTAELYAREHPDRVVGIVLLDALTGRMIDDMPDAGRHMAHDACLARTLNRFGLLRLLDPLDRRERGDDRDLALTYRASTWNAVCSLVEARATSAEQIRASPPLRSDLPIVVVRHDSAKASGPDDTVSEAQWQAAQAANAALTKRGELLVAPGSGHHIAEDRPDLVVATVMRLIDELGQR